MNGKIFVLNEDNSTLTPLQEGPFESEDVFQYLLEKYPDLLAGEQMTPSSPRRWLLISREYGVPRAEDQGDWWSLDHLFIDHEAVPTLVEVKRASDTRARREVVAQMLDYAANGVAYWPVERMRERFMSACELKREDPLQLIADLVGPAGDPGADAELFWQRVKTNLQAGRIRMVFVADVISEELRRIVEFLNVQMDPAEVLAVEIRHFAGHGLRTLVPRVIGQTSLGVGSVGGGTTPSRRTWNEQSWFAALSERLGLDELQTVKGFFEFCRRVADRIDWGTGLTGSFSPKFASYHPTIGPLTVWGDGAMSLRCTWLRDQPEKFAMALRFGEALARIEGLDVPARYRETDVALSLETWAPHRLEIERIIDEIFVQTP